MDCFGKPITVECVDNVAVIRMLRGENRINSDFVEKFNAALDQIESNNGIKAMLLTGDGGRFFSNGIDLNWIVPYSNNGIKAMLLTGDGGRFFSNGIDLNWIVPYRQRKDMDVVLAFNKSFNELLVRLLTFPVVTVAALNGHTFAGGAFIALCCDYRVMNAEKGWFCLNEVHINMVVDDLKKHLLRRVLPSSIYRRALTLGERFTGPEALEANLVDSVVKPENFLQASMSFLRTKAPPKGIAREALGNMKKQCFDDILAIDRVKIPPANM